MSAPGKGEGFFRSRWARPPVGIEELEPTALAPGFRAAGVACGIKASGGTDVGIVVCDEPDVSSALLLTRNAAAAAPIRVCRERCDQAGLRAAVVNSGNANAARTARARATSTGSGAKMRLHAST